MLEEFASTKYFDLLTLFEQWRYTHQKTQDFLHEAFVHTM